jgi:hypothetical protein
MISRIRIHNKPSTLLLLQQSLHFGPDQFPHLGEISPSLRSVTPEKSAHIETDYPDLQQQVPCHVGCNQGVVVSTVWCSLDMLESDLQSRVIRVGDLTLRPRQSDCVPPYQMSA